MFCGSTVENKKNPAYFDVKLLKSPITLMFLKMSYIFWGIWSTIPKYKKKAMTNIFNDVVTLDLAFNFQNMMQLVVFIDATRLYIFVERRSAFVEGLRGSTRTTSVTRSCTIPIMHVPSWNSVGDLYAFAAYCYEFFFVSIEEDNSPSFLRIILSQCLL